MAFLFAGLSNRDDKYLKANQDSHQNCADKQSRPILLRQSEIV